MRAFLQPFVRRLVLFTAFTFLALCISAPSLVAQQGAAADGHALIGFDIDIFIPRTAAYGINDGHRFNTAEPIEVSALQWSLWETDRTATFVTVFGEDSAAGRRQLYQEIHGFAPGTVRLEGENTLTLAGETYFPTRVEMLPRSEIAAQFPELDLSRLAPRQPNEEYALVVWNDVIYANGRYFGAGFSLSEVLGFTDLFGRPGRFTELYRTMSVDCPCPADRHPFRVLRPGLEVVAAHYQQPLGTGLHNEVLSVIGLSSGKPGDPWNGMQGFEGGLVELGGDSVMADAAGLEHLSAPRLMAAEEIAAEFPQMDVSNLAGGGLYVVDYWPEVQMVEADDTSISRVRGTLRINGQNRVIEALGVERGTSIGVQSLSGTLNIDGRPAPRDEQILWWLLVIQVTGIDVDANVGVLAQPGDRARAVIRVGGNGTPIRGVMTQNVVVTSTDPWVTDVEIRGQLRVDEGLTCELPMVKDDMDFLVENRRATGSATLLGGCRGNNVEIPVDYRVTWSGAATRELPARFVGSVTLESYDPASGFRGNVVRLEAAP